MITKAYSVYDSKALMFNTPFFMATPGMALRAFSDLSNDPQSMISRHPEDYVLYEIGVFDDTKGELIPHSPLVQLGIASQYKNGFLAERVGSPEVVS